MLSPVEDFWLRWHVEHSPDRVAERARLVLEAETGGSPSQAAANLGLRIDTVQQAITSFEKEGLSAFPRAKVDLNHLIQYNPGDPQRGRHIAEQAKRLFNETRPLHHLSRSLRPLLEDEQRVVLTLPAS